MIITDGFARAPVTTELQHAVRSQCSPEEGTVLRAFSESPLPHIPGASLGNVLSLAQAAVKNWNLGHTNLLIIAS